MAEEKGTKPGRERHVLDEEHGFDHVTPLPRELLQRQIDKDLAGEESDVDDDEVVAALRGVAA